MIVLHTRVRIHTHTQLRLGSIGADPAPLVVKAKHKQGPQLITEILSLHSSGCQCLC